MAFSVVCSGAPSRGWMYTAKDLHLHLGSLSICSKCSVVLIVMGGHQGMIHLSSKDSPSMVKVTIREVQFTMGENKENHSIPNNIQYDKVGTIRKAISQT